MAWEGRRKRGGGLGGRERGEERPSYALSFFTNFQILLKIELITLTELKVDM